MDTALQMFNVQMPLSDIRLFKELSDKMGWIAKEVKSNSKMNELDKAILDVKKGKVKTFDSVEDMMAYLND